MTICGRSIQVQCTCYKRTRIIRPNGHIGPNSHVAAEFPNGALRQRSCATAIVYIHHALCLAWHSFSVFPGTFSNVFQSDFFWWVVRCSAFDCRMKSTSIFIDYLTTPFQLHSIEMNEMLIRNAESSRSFRRHSYYIEVQYGSRKFTLKTEKLPIHIVKRPYINFSNNLIEQQFCRLLWPEFLLIISFIKTATEM